jgi:hypothetical protein
MYNLGDMCTSSSIVQALPSIKNACPSQLRALASRHSLALQDLDPVRRRRFLSRPGSKLRIVLHHNHQRSSTRDLVK